MKKSKSKKKDKKKSKSEDKKKSKSKKELVFYPEIDDPDFQKIIYQKKEFHDNIIPKETRSYSEICKPNLADFSLLPQQNFLKNFMSIKLIGSCPTL